MKIFQSTIIIALLTFLMSAACKPENEILAGESANTTSGELDLSVSIPPGGNSWVINDIPENDNVISDNGIHNWTDENHVIRTYFKVYSTGDLHVGLDAMAPTGNSTLTITVGENSEQITLSNTAYDSIPVGIFPINEAGYHYIEISCDQTTSNYVADINTIYIGGPATAANVTYVPDEFYWGRRGPSVHLSYTMPEGEDIEWFYNEITVPQGEDVVGSYFMANGFAEGYFGMQVNSETERRVLFSVWSPYDTQNPDDIPDAYKIELLGYGEGVTVGEFGNEGSGGQSYKVFDWQPGNTYKFLLKGVPSGNDKTDYTAYFYAPETGEWNLIASFRRPFTDTYLKRFHSFLENFDTKTGFKSRKGTYGNQWVRDAQGNWHELTEAIFTADATARSGNRLDYAGGSDGNLFFMQNCGFFSENTTIDSQHTRQANGTAPSIDFSSLEVPDISSGPQFKDKSGWQIDAFSSEATAGEGSNGLANLVMDNDPATYWHSCWSGCNENYDYPHFLTIDMGSMENIEGLAFAQRDGSRKVKDLEILISSDNISWKGLGDFVLADHANTQSVALSQSEQCRYIKINMKSAHDGQTFAALAEVWAY